LQLLTYSTSRVLLEKLTGVQKIFFSLSRIMMSGLLLGTVLSVCTCLRHNIYYYYYYYRYQEIYIKRITKYDNHINMKEHKFCNLTQQNMVAKYRRFGRLCYLQLHGLWSSSKYGKYDTSHPRRPESYFSPREKPEYYIHLAHKYFTILMLGIK
jgi:hypothetical protein